MPIGEAGLSMVYSVLDYLNSGITDSNPTEEMGVCSLACFRYFEQEVLEKTNRLLSLIRRGPH
jgi:hypothetical protein